MGKNDLIENLIRLSEGKLFLLKQLLTLSGQQSKNIGSGEAEKLSELIEQKQNIMTRIDDLDREFVKKYDLLKSSIVVETSEGLRPDERDKMGVLQDRITEIYSLTKKIQKIDIANVKKLEKNLQSVQNELKKVRAGKKAVQGYSKKDTEGISIFLDKKQ
ncbi:MAG TPA: flagellar export chaperone FlgN [Oscillospiraceae bacterium]|nr:flagellar export chaperone FlgN [Oscillospiraceae bacterium]